jgi:hypothetical protein
MTKRSTLTAAVAAVSVIIMGCAGESSSAAATSPAATTSSTGTTSTGTTSTGSTSTGSTSTGTTSTGTTSTGTTSTGSTTSSGTPSITTSVPTESFGCGGATRSASTGSPSGPSLRITLQGNDPTQTYTAGSKFTVKFQTESKGADVIGWQIADYTGNVHASGSIDVSAGATTASVSCTSTISGYFAVSAKLHNSGATEPQQGSRPEGYAAFGVLPNVADYVPAFNASLDERRVGLVGTNDVEAGTGLEPMNENLGTSWIMTSRAMSLTEPQHAGQYNPATYQIDPSIKEGNLGRVVYMNGLPFWASTAPSPESGGSYPPKSFSYFQSYAAQVGEESVRLDKEYIHNEHTNYYQASWEPDPGPSTEWKGTDAQFIELYKSTWEGVHSTDPNAKVIGPATQSIGICQSWLERLAPMGFTKYLDGLSCHGYYIVGASSALPPEVGNLPTKLQSLRKVMTSLMPGKPLIVTETGIGYPMKTNYAANYPTNSVLTEHAEAVVRTHLIMLGEGVDKSFVFYSADFDSPVGFGMYFNLNISSYASGNLQPKPTAMAVAAATRLVDGSRSLGGLTNMPSGGYGYTFLLADSKHTMTALWAHNGSFNASETYEVQVDSSGTSGKTVMFDAMGNPKTVDYSNGLLKVTISEMPVYVLSSNVSAAKSHVRAPEGYSTSF